MKERKSGILLHITSLPGHEGIGTLGHDAFRFVDFLAGCNQKTWQILPLGPTGYGDSPYQSYSAFAGNILMIDLHLLAKDGLVSSTRLKHNLGFKKKKALFQETQEWKIPILGEAFQSFKQDKQVSLQKEYNGFIEENSWWLNDYALFISCKKHFNGKAWNEWEDGLKYRGSDTLKLYAAKLHEEIEFRKFLQFLFFRQWYALKKYANFKGISIFGDVPLYVSTDSADVWANPTLFKLDEDLKPTHVGGVPPDYFSEDGQLWGNPVYDWDEIKKQDFGWWLARLHFNLRMFDLARIDHFRGLSAYWSVEAGKQNAIDGEWLPAYGHELLSKFKGQIGHLPLVAEDLGEIDEHVEKLRDDFNLPGMKVLQFGFSSDPTSGHLPHNYPPNFIAYTGTHDNNTSSGWFLSSGKNEKKLVKKYFKASRRKIARQMINAVWASGAQMAITPLQDLLGLGAQTRMNVPGIPDGNWAWRFQWKQIKRKQIRFLKEITEKYNR